jgi:hypothetical protein
MDSIALYRRHIHSIRHAGTLTIANRAVAAIAAMGEDADREFALHVYRHSVARILAG